MQVGGRVGAVAQRVPDKLRHAEGDNQLGEYAFLAALPHLKCLTHLKYCLLGLCHPDTRDSF